MLRALVVTLAYALCAWFSLLFVVQPEKLASFWPPSGLMLAALLLSHKRQWPLLVLGVFLANIVANVISGNALLISAGFGVANCAESVAAAWVVDKMLGTPIAMTRLKEVIGVTVLAALLSNALTALLGAAIPSLGFGAPYWAVWRVWWIADAIGILIVAPVILSWAPVDWATLRRLLRERGLEALVLFGTMTVLAQYVFSSDSRGTSFLLPFPYATFPFLLWAAVRFGPRGSSLAALVLALIAVWHTSRHTGPFAAASGSLASQVLSTQAFIGVVALSALMLGAVIDERQQAELALRVANEGLEIKVLERTKELTDTNQKLRSEIAERKRAEEALARSNGELARSNSELEQFAYVASHDLKEPLRAVAGTVQLLERRYKGQLDERANEFIVHIVDGVNRMQSLINDLLAFSRIGNRNHTSQPINCEAIMKDVLSNLAAAIRDSDAVVTCEGLPTRLMSNPTHLLQLFQNLVGNAIKFRGEARPEIQVKAERKGNEWLFVVRDNGIGIESEYFERIFAIFQRLHTRRAYPGTGIGLAICKKIVEVHAGRIWVESMPGKGSAFFFTHPAAADEVNIPRSAAG